VKNFIKSFAAESLVEEHHIGFLDSSFSKFKSVAADHIMYGGVLSG